MIKTSRVGITVEIQHYVCDFCPATSVDGSHSFAPEEKPRSMAIEAEWRTLTEFLHHRRAFAMPEGWKSQGTTNGDKYTTLFHMCPACSGKYETLMQETVAKMKNAATPAPRADWAKYMVGED